MDVGNAIKKLRIKKTLNQMDFANKIGITQSYLSQLEHSHKKPSLELLENIASYFDVPLPVMFWFSVEESDICESKRESFRMMKGSIDALINSII